jgi:hypothetical protein
MDNKGDLLNTFFSESLILWYTVKYMAPLGIFASMVGPSPWYMPMNPPSCHIARPVPMRPLSWNERRFLTGSSVHSWSPPLPCSLIFITSRGLVTMLEAIALVAPARLRIELSETRTVRCSRWERRGAGSCGRLSCSWILIRPFRRSVNYQRIARGAWKALWLVRVNIMWSRGGDGHLVRIVSFPKQQNM